MFRVVKSVQRIVICAVCIMKCKVPVRSGKGLLYSVLYLVDSVKCGVCSEIYYTVCCT